MELRILFSVCILMALSVCGSKLRSSHSSLHQQWSSYAIIDTIYSALGLGMTDPDCKLADLGDVSEDPDNCLNFYMCDGIGGFNGPIPCPEGQCFDGIEGSSTNSCIPIVQDANTCGCDSFKPPVPQCITKCDSDANLGAQIAFMDDCKKHGICTLNGIFETECPSDRPYFNGESCGNDKLKCCNCQEPTCGENDKGELFVDPLDCHSYYACVDLGGIITIEQLTCVDGGSFVNGKCDPNTNKCTNIC